jgi:putative aldouronate transport system substrate-binding protein
VEKEWDSYLKELDRLGLQDWLEIKQAGYDRNQ